MERQITASNMKIVVCLRNVKDVLVSYYECYKILDGWGDFSGTWDEFFEMFVSNNIAYGNYFDWVREYWQAAKTNDKILIIKYEDLKKSPHKEIGRIADFCERSLSDEQIEKIVQFSSFDAMKENPNTNYYKTIPLIGKKGDKFFRKGVVGDWKNYFTQKQNEIIDQLIEEKLTSIGLYFDYE